MADQNFTVYSGDIKTLAVPVVNTTPTAVDVSLAQRIVWRWFEQTRVSNQTVIDTDVALLKALAFEWAALTAYALHDFVIPTTPNGYQYEATIAGTSAAVTEPTWPTTVGQTVVDSGVTWTCRPLGVTFNTDGEDGLLNVLLGTGDTDALVGTYYHEMWLKDVDDNEQPLMSGVATVKLDRITS